MGNPKKLWKKIWETLKSSRRRRCGKTLKNFKRRCAKTLTSLGNPKTLQKKKMWESPNKL
jgi:hypothetical protein